MEEFRKLERFLNYSSIQDTNESYKELAAELMGNFYIRQGGVVYYFLEIEVYYYSPEHEDKIEILEKKRFIENGRSVAKITGTGRYKPFVYQRNVNEKDAGCFLLHDSGVDICFSGKVDHADTINSKGGGILIRTLLRIDGEDMSYVSGPWDCRDALFNYTSKECYPELVYSKGIVKDLALGQVWRCNANGELDRQGALYAFYNSNHVAEGKWKCGKRYDPLRISKEKESYSNKPWDRVLHR